MSVTFDIMWREAMMELLEQLEAEMPDDPEFAPQTLEAWGAVYVRYLQIFRKLEEAYDQMVHPQKRQDLKKALAATMGRILEIRNWMVDLNNGVDEVNLESALSDLKLRPEDLEVPVPRLFAEEQHVKMADKRKLMDAVLEQKGQAPVDASADPGAANVVLPLPSLDVVEALKVIKCNERGRQGRERFNAMRIDMRVHRAEEQRERDGQPPPSRHDAATQIQAVCRSFLARREVALMREEELEFLGMTLPLKHPGADEAHELEQRNVMKRKMTQRDNREEYEEALVVLRQRVKEMEGQDMRETIQDAVNAWFIDSRKPDGTYPDFPEEEDGGSKIILNPPPEPIEGEEEEKGKGKDAKGKGKGKGKEAEGEGEAKEIPSQFIPGIEEAVKEYIERWQDKDESGNFWQKYDPELVKEEVRPLVFEEIRQEVDEEMRVLLANLVEMVEAERAAQKGGKYKKKKKKKKKGKGKKKGGKGKGKKYKDLTADRDPVSLFTELVTNGIVKPLSRVGVSDFIGAASPVSGEMAQAIEPSEPSMAQVRHLVTEYCILPIGLRDVHEKAPYYKAVLLYGANRTGKSMLCQAIANSAGATLFDLSPDVTNGKYRGKGETTKLVHMVHKVARLYAPSVITIDHFEKVMVGDKKRQKAYTEMLRLDEPAGRIKKDLLKEYKFNVPGDQVLILGMSSAPFDAVKKDKKAFVGFFQKHIYCPLPDYGSRVLLWRALFEKHGAPLSREFDVSTLAKVTEGYTSGDIDRIVRTIATESRIDRLHHGEEIRMAEIVTWMTRVPPVDTSVVAAFKQWMSELPARAKKDGGGKEGGKKGKKK